MIPARIYQQPRVLSAVPAGGAEYIWFDDVIVDQKNGSTYIRQDAKLTNESNPLAVRISRGPDGCRVIIYQKCTRFMPKQIADYSNLIPTVEVIQEVAPDVCDR